MTGTNYFCIVFSDEQVNFFAGSKYGIDRMKILKLLIDCTVQEETIYKSKGFTTTLHIGQAAISEVQLATQLGYDKKTVSRLLDKMIQLGIITTTKNNRTSIHTLHCVSAWYVNNRQIMNPSYVFMKDRHLKRTSSDAPTNNALANEPSLSDKEGTPAKTYKSKTNFHSHESKANETDGTEPGVNHFPIVHSDELSENVECPKQVIEPTATPNDPEAGTFDVPQLSNPSSTDNIGNEAENLTADNDIHSHNAVLSAESKSEAFGNVSTAASISDTSTDSNPSNNA